MIQWKSDEQKQPLICFHVLVSCLLRSIRCSVQSRSNFGQVLVKFWSSFGQVLVKFWSSSDQVLVMFWSSYGFWSSSGQVAANHWYQAVVRLWSGCGQVMYGLALVERLCWSGQEASQCLGQTHRRKTIGAFLGSSGPASRRSGVVGQLLIKFWSFLWCHGRGGDVFLVLVSATWAP